MHQSSRKKIRSLPRTKFVPMGLNKTNGLKCFFLEIEASISCIPMGTTHFSLPIVKTIDSLPRTKFVLKMRQTLIPNKTNACWAKPTHQYYASQ